MKTKTTDDKTQVLGQLLEEARREADTYRKRMKRLEKIVLSTRLIMGHELKKPTTAITGYLDLVCEDLEKSGDLATLAYAQKAQGECRLLDRLSSFYIELLKIETCEGTVNRSRVDIAALISEVVESLPSKLDARSRVSINITPGAGTIEINPNAMKLIVLNLIENSLLYSERNASVRVEVEKLNEKRGMRGGEVVRLRVKDSGMGIPEHNLKKVFSPFVRLRDDVVGGSGLGLTLVRSLVELNDGHVLIRSTINKGTTVFVTIPVVARKSEERAVLT